jgi:hypothetical protein
MKYQIYCSNGNHFTGIGGAIIVRLSYINNEGKKKSLRLNNGELQGTLLFGTRSAAKISFVGIFAVITERIKESGIENYNINQNTINFPTEIDGMKELEVKLLKLVDSIVDDFNEIKQGNIQTCLDYKIKQEDYPNYIVIFKQKYCDRYFIVNHPDKLHKAFLKILIERNEEKWFDWMKDHKPYEGPNHKRPDFTLEEVRNLPETMADTKANMLRELAKWKREDDMSIEHKNLYVEIQQAIEDKNALQAYYILSSMKGGEYDGFTIEQGEDY